MKKKFAFLLWLCVSASPAYATIETDATVDILQILVSGSCSISLTDDEPYSHITSECSLLETDGTTVSRQNDQPISAYSLGYPRDNDPLPSHYDWPTLLNNPNEEKIYCQEFGAPTIFLGHHSNSNQNLELEGKGNCIGSSPEPPEASVELLFCIGWEGTYYVDWDGDLFHTPDYFEVEYKNEFGWWVPSYEGIAGATSIASKLAQISMRIKIVCLHGTTVWVNFGTNENCMNGPPM